MWFRWRMPSGFESRHPLRVRGDCRLVAPVCKTGALRGRRRFDSCLAHDRFPQPLGDAGRRRPLCAPSPGTAVVAGHGAVRRCGGGPAKPAAEGSTPSRVSTPPRPHEPLGKGLAAGSPKPGLPVRFRARGPRVSSIVEMAVDLQDRTPAADDPLAFTTLRPLTGRRPD